jgi:hypothetical protein
MPEYELHHRWLLVPFHALSRSIFQLHELHIDLHVASWDRFGIPFGVQSTSGSALGQPRDPMRFQYPAHCGFGNPDPILAVR